MADECGGDHVSDAAGASGDENIFARDAEEGLGRCHGENRISFFHGFLDFLWNLDLFLSAK